MEVELAQLPLTLESFSATTTSPMYIQSTSTSSSWLAEWEERSNDRSKEGTTKVVRKEHS